LQVAATTESPRNTAKALAPGLSVDRRRGKTGRQLAPRETVGVTPSVTRIAVHPPDSCSLWQGSASCLAWSALPLQRKLAVGAVNDPLEHEADLVADRVMRMPDPASIATASSSALKLQRKCSCGSSAGGECESCRKEKEGMVRRSSSSAPPALYAPSIVHDVVRSPGEPLDRATLAFFEPRLARDLSRVRTHVGSQASESARCVNAVAYTAGNDIVFRDGAYSPNTTQGRRLLAHELAHTLQQAELSPQRLQRTQQVTLTLKGRPSMTVVIGELRFTKDAIEDVLKSGALLPSADQAHVGFKGDQLGYDPNYTNPTDPYRWNKLKEIVDSDQKIQVRKVEPLGQIKVLFISPQGRTVMDDNLRSLGLTLPTETLQKKISPTETTMTVSPSSDTHQVLYTTALGTPADSSLAHELFGHMWLALKGVPWQHPSKPADIVARGTLTAQHGIRDPFGNIYTGTVQDYIDRYAGSERGMLASPTQNVGSQLLQNAMTAFRSSFGSGAKGTLNGPWNVSADASNQWEIISTNYVLAPKPAPQTPASAPSGVPAPTVTPAPKQAPAPTTTPSTSSAPTTAPSTAPAANPTVTQASIEQDVAKFYTALNPDKQYVFIKFMESVQADIQRRSQLATQMLKTLNKPAGMASSNISIP